MDLESTVAYAAACGSFEILAEYVGLDNNPERITSSGHVACYESSLCMPKTRSPLLMLIIKCPRKTRGLGDLYAH